MDDRKARREGEKEKLESKRRLNETKKIQQSRLDL